MQLAAEGTLVLPLAAEGTLVLPLAAQMVTDLERHGPPVLATEARPPWWPYAEVSHSPRREQPQRTQSSLCSLAGGSKDMPERTDSLTRDRS